MFQAQASGLKKILGILNKALKKKTSASAWRVTMAPRQLRLEPIEVDPTADKGPSKVQRCQASPRRQHRGVLNTGTKSPPARQPGARPGRAQRTAGPLLTTCQSSGSRHGM
eukprot:scaffold11383_cov123-Isochrysis_galbana.AAC.6